VREEERRERDEKIKKKIDGEERENGLRTTNYGLYTDYDTRAGE